MDSKILLKFCGLRTALLKQAGSDNTGKPCNFNVIRQMWSNFLQSSGSPEEISGHGGAYGNHQKSHDFLIQLLCVMGATVSA